MSEHRPGEGGPANTPPFPRLVPDDPESPTAGVPTQRPTGERIHIVAEAVARPEIREIPVPNRQEAPAKGQNDDPASEGPSAEEADLSDLVADAADKVRSAGRSVNRGFQNIAEQLEDLADRLESVAGLGESRGAAGLARVARRSSEVLGGSANYLRTSDLPQIRADLEQQLRTSPVKTLLVALGAGWLVGKVVR